MKKEFQIIEDDQSPPDGWTVKVAAEGLRCGIDGKSVVVVDDATNHLTKTYSVDGRLSKGDIALLAFGAGMRAARKP